MINFGAPSFRVVVVVFLCFLSVCAGMNISASSLDPKTIYSSPTSSSWGFSTFTKSVLKLMPFSPSIVRESLKYFKLSDNLNMLMPLAAVLDVSSVVTSNQTKLSSTAGELLYYFVTTVTSLIQNNRLNEYFFFHVLFGSIASTATVWAFHSIYTCTTSITWFNAILYFLLTSSLYFARHEKFTPSILAAGLAVFFQVVGKEIANNPWFLVKFFIFGEATVNKQVVRALSHLSVVCSLSYAVPYFLISRIHICFSHQSSLYQSTLTFSLIFYVSTQIIWPPESSCENQVEERKHDGPTDPRKEKEASKERLRVQQKIRMKLSEKSAFSNSELNTSSKERVVPEEVRTFLRNRFKGKIPLVREKPEPVLLTQQSETSVYVKRVTSQSWWHVLFYLLCGFFSVLAVIMYVAWDIFKHFLRNPTVVANMYVLWDDALSDKDRERTYVGFWRCFSRRFHERLLRIGGDIQSATKEDEKSLSGRVLRPRVAQISKHAAKGSGQRLGGTDTARDLKKLTQRHRPPAVNPACESAGSELPVSDANPTASGLQFIVTASETDIVQQQGQIEPENPQPVSKPKSEVLGKRPHALDEAGPGMDFDEEDPGNEPGGPAKSKKTKTKTTF